MFISGHQINRKITPKVCLQKNWVISSFQSTNAKKIMQLLLMFPNKIIFHSSYLMVFFHQGANGQLSNFKITFFSINLISILASKTAVVEPPEMCDWYQIFAKIKLLFLGNYNLKFLFRIFCDNFASSLEEMILFFIIVNFLLCFENMTGKNYQEEQTTMSFLDIQTHLPQNLETKLYNQGPKRQLSVQK